MCAPSDSRQPAARAITDIRRAYPDGGARRPALVWPRCSNNGDMSIAPVCARAHTICRHRCKDEPMGGELRLHLSEEDADVERLAMLVGYLRSELLQLDVEDVTWLPGGEP